MKNQTQLDMAKARQISKTTPTTNVAPRKSTRRQSKLGNVEVENKLSHAKTGPKKVKHIGDYPHDMLA